MSRKPKANLHKSIAPRLASGERRMGNFHSLPPEVKDGLRAIAKFENQSVSWVIEQSLIDYFGLRKPAYKKGHKK